MTDQPPAIGQTWTGRFESSRVVVLEVTDRHVEFEASHKPGFIRKFTRAQFTRAFRPPKEQQ